MKTALPIALIFILLPFTSAQPDLSMDQNDLILYPEMPVVGDTVAVWATVHNIGPDDAQTQIGLFINDNEIDRRRIFVPAEGTRTTYFRWMPDEGPVVLIIRADPDNSIAELSEENNEASRQFTVHKPFRLLVIPYNWHGNYSAFNERAWGLSIDYLERIPLWDCMNQFDLVIPDERNYGDSWDGWSCSDEDMIKPRCNSSDALATIYRCAFDYRAKTGHGFDFVAAISDRDIGLARPGVIDPSGENCSWNVAGWSDGEGGYPVVLSEDQNGTIVHELGHEFGLSDEYCDCSGTEYAKFCGPDAAINPLVTAYGCTPGEGNGCCHGYGGGPYSPSCGWCDGNLDTQSEDQDGDGNLDTGDPSIMSNLFLYGVFSYYSPDAYHHLGDAPNLNCHQSRLRFVEGTYLDFDLSIARNGSVHSNSITVSDGDPVVRDGDYTLDLLDEHFDPLSSTGFPVDFVALSDPPLILDQEDILVRVPYFTEARHAKIRHHNATIFDFDVPSFCDSDGICDGRESWRSCEDCSSWGFDHECNPRADGHCDPDCGNLDSDCCVIPQDHMVLDHNVTLCVGDYSVPAGIAISGEGVTITGNRTRIIGNGTGIGVSIDARGSRVMSVSVDNYSIGILVQGDGDTVEGLSMKFCGTAALFDGVTRCSISNNTFNAQRGVVLTESHGNTFWGNVFQTNDTPAWENESWDVNDWNLSREGNIWDSRLSNLSSTREYPIPGPGPGIDHHPQWRFGPTKPWMMASEIR